jgi:HSP20 family molecular chaperone IbpA
MKDDDKTPQEHEAEPMGAQDEAQEQSSSDDGSKLPAEQEGSGERTRSRPTFRPRCDILETEEGLTILADMPGAKAETLEVHVEKRELSIRAEVEEAAPEGMSLAIREYQAGDWERRFAVSREFDLERVSASLTDGVLKLTLPKAREAEARRIDVTAG